MKTNKHHSNLLFAFIIALTSVCFESCQNQSSMSETTNCTSKKMSNQMKQENNLFLSFYYGMTPDEFSNEERKLISSGALQHSDSTTKFTLTVASNNPDEISNEGDKCVFILTPSFEECSLYAVSLECVPENVSATVSPYDSKRSYDSETKKVPDASIIASVDKLYASKYGKPQISELGGLNNVLEKKWTDKNKGIYMYCNYGFSRGIDGKNYKILTGARINYSSMVYEKMKSMSRDSTDRRKIIETNKQINSSKLSI